MQACQPLFGGSMGVAPPVGSKTYNPHTYPLVPESRKDYAENISHMTTTLARKGSIVCFTDGSKWESPEGPKVGAGFVVYHKGVLITELSKGIGPRFEVFDAEMIALAEAASCAVSKASSLGSHHIIFFADNKAALSNITLLSKHPGVKGNERADVLANKGGSEPPLHTYNRSITWCKAEATRTASRTWTQEWSNQPHSRFIADHIRRNPSLSLHPFFKAFPYHRAIHARLNQVIMGHAFLGEYRERFRPDDDPSCPCGAPRQTLDHVLRACPSYDHARLSLRKASGPILNSSLFGTTSGLRALATFINSTDAFQI
ncbi:Reverse transcriptase (RNA-dependent DNA polymerase) [Rhizoctonia solani]|uniref:Reverse transcriptase (RNA-dependent DNA polymerase) n=1 Tax=Rhizoctonia solani TaxID=456999 RepID=A0A8H7IK50_9AGAM|nr:Reverse transcriptase (RNA-dependent DNA polymerase) [Rhizoctonia solani]